MRNFYTDPVNTGELDAPQSKVASLLTKSTDKLTTLTGATSLTRGVEVNTGDGYVEDSGNKLWEGYDLNPAEYDYMVGLAASTSQKPDGGAEDARRLYLFGTKDEGNTQPNTNLDSGLTPLADYGMQRPVKPGLARGDLATSNFRHIQGSDGNYGWESGPKGVDVTKKFMDLNLQQDVGTALEGFGHVRKTALADRLLRKREDGLYDIQIPEGIQTIDKAQKDAMFGSGSSEYYTGAEGYFGDSRDFAVDKEKVAKLLEEGTQKAKYKRLMEGNTRYMSYEDLVERKKLQGQQQVETSGEDNTMDDWMKALVQVESGGDANAVSSAGAFGLTQLMPETAKNPGFGIEPMRENTPEEQMRVGTEYFAALNDKYRNVDDALRAYNWGTGNVDKWIAGGRDESKLPQETLEYVGKVKGNLPDVAGSAISAPTGEVLSFEERVRRREEAEEGRFTNLVDAAQYGLGRKAAGVGDMLLDGMTRVAKDGVRLFADKTEKELNENLQRNIQGTNLANLFDKNGDFVGLDEYKAAAEYAYDDSNTKEVISKVGEAYKDKDWLRLAGEIASGVVTAGPEFLLESSGEVVMVALGPLGLALNAGDYSNQIMEERLNNVDSGELTYADRTIAIAGGTAMAYLNKIGVDELVGNTSVVKNALKAVKLYGTDQQAKSIAKRLVSMTTNTSLVVGGKGIYEGIEEVAQEAVSIVAEKIGTKEANQILSDASGQRLVEGFAGGFAGGVTATIPGQAIGTIGNASKMVKLPKLGRRAVGSGNITAEDQELTEENLINAVGRVDAGIDAEGPGVNAGNVSMLVSDLTLMREFKDYMGDEDPQKVEFNKLYEKGIDSLEAFVKGNSEVKLDKRTATKLGLEGKVLGSSAVYAEEVAHLILGSSRTYDEAFVSQVSTLMKVNGVDETRVENIIKSYASVEVEARDSERGYYTYENRIKLALASDNPDTSIIKKNYANLQKFYSSTTNSIQGIESGLEKVKNQVAKLNKMAEAGVPVPGGDKTKRVTVPYMKANKKEYTVDIVRTDDGKWKALTADLEKRLDEKLVTKKDIYGILSNLSPKVSGVVGNAVNLGSLVIPSTTPGTAKVVKDLRSKDESHIATQLENIERVLGELRQITKVIVDDADGGRTAKWEESSDYRKANLGIINTKQSDAGVRYVKDDVVLLHAAGTFKLKDGKLASTVYKKDSNLRAEVDAAMEAGATIVLDRELAQGKDIAKGKKYATARMSLGKFLTSKDRGYKLITQGNKSTYVKVTDEVVPKLEAEKVRVEAKKSATRTTTALTKELIETKAAEASGTATPEAIATMNSEFEKDETLQGKVTREYRKGVNAVKRQLGRDVAEEDRVAASAAVYAVAEAEYAKGATDSSLAEIVLDAWKDFTEVQGLRGKALVTALNKVLDENGLETSAKEVVNDLLSKFAVGKDKPVIWENIVEVHTYRGNTVVSKDIEYRPLWKEPTNKAAYFSGDGKRDGNKLVIPVGLRKVTMDSTELVKVSEPTVLNTMPVSMLPRLLQDLAKQAVYTFKKIAPVAREGEVATAEELQNQKKTKDQGWLEGGFGIHNSPVRGLLLGEDGQVSESMLLAMNLGILDAIRTDKRKLMKGYKDTQSIAALFGVQEHEVTREMRDFAKEHGSFKKTIAHAVGKNALKLVGISKNDLEDGGMYSFERLVADVGNLALFMAKKDGLIEFTSAESSELAKLMSQNQEDVGDMHSSKATTTFVNLRSTKEKVPGTKFTREKLDSKVEEADVLAAEVAELLPEFKNLETGPSLYKPGAEKLEELSTTVLNNLSGKEVPELARKAIKTMSSTAHRFDMAKIGSLLEAVDNEAYDVKGVLGFVVEDSDKFKKLTFEEKEVQEVTNEEVEKSIRVLREFHDKHKDSAVDGVVSLYFDYAYLTNGRYQLLSNTINPQNDTLHRFAVLPDAVTAKVEIGDGGLKVNGKKMNFKYRFAIGQAFGQDVDKQSPEAVIAYGNAMMSLTLDQIAKLRDDLLTEGKAEVVVGTGKSAETFAVKGDHLAHTLAALEFIENIVNGETSFVSDLTVEFDSLTSGFANKTQQFPVLDDEVMEKHFARVGVVTSGFMDSISESGIEVKGKGVNNLLGRGQEIQFKDSYQNLAAKVLEGAREALSGIENKTLVRLFGYVAPVLPGSAAIQGTGEAVIDKAMRSLFKNPFMIFNYSAGINRIKKNLASNIAADVLSQIAKGDEVGVLAGQNLVKEYGKGLGVKTVGELQELIRTKSTNEIKVKLGDKQVTLVSQLEAMAEEVYGKQVEQVFTDEFGEFLELQDTINDSFKVMFRVFDSERMELMKEAGKKGYITKKDQQGIIDALWAKFPSIVGPLSDRNKLKEIIPIIDKKLGSPSLITEAGRPTRAVLLGEEKGIVVRPLVMEMAEVNNAGSVLPFHDIDGAEMATMLDAFMSELGMSKEIGGLIAIHDAIIPSLEHADEIAFLYNKAMFEINKNYSIMAELKKKMDSFPDAKDIKNVDKITVKGLVVNRTPSGGQDKTMLFSKAYKLVQDKVTEAAERVSKAREKWYNGPLATAWFGNMIGTPGALYKEGMDKPDTSYEEVFEGQGLYDLGKKKRSPTKKATTSVIDVDELKDNNKKYKDCKK